ncbi:hypothetical protein MMC17_001687 [Xylographa soralifera]|nr:hypothetical protein [Xylographa soralifera]
MASPGDKWGLVFWPEDGWVRLAFWISYLEFEEEHDAHDKAELYKHYLKTLLPIPTERESIATYGRKLSISDAKMVMGNFRKFQLNIEQELASKLVDGHGEDKRLLKEVNFGLIRGIFSQAANVTWKMSDAWRRDDLTEIFTKNRGLFKSKGPPKFTPITTEVFARLEPSTLNPKFERNIKFSDPKTSLLDVHIALETIEIINLQDPKQDGEERNALSEILKNN